MGCNCGSSRASGVRYEVTFANGTKQVYNTVSEAQAAGNQSGGAYTFKAIPA